MNYIRFDYDGEKAEEMAAFLVRLEGGTMSVMKLMKLMYLVEREYLRRKGRTITGDSFVSMKHGPVLSNYYNRLKGDNLHEGRELLQKEEEVDFNLCLKSEGKAFSPERLTRLEIEILNSVYAEHGIKTGWQLRNYTHKHLPEWDDPGESCLPIGTLAILKALNKTKPDITDAQESADKSWDIKQAFSD